MNTHAVVAIFRRNLTSYFSSPTGYVFICVFVFLSAIATFWPNDFFNSNLANLDQLNKYFPLIMLVFIPAITMSIWSEERRLGTDELLLTIPATDFDVVAGKYLAAVAIFSISLIFSLTNVIILLLLGTPDWGIIFANYLGFWLVGVAMLSIGMVASFLTSNLTVAFILAVVFNAPLAVALSQLGTGIDLSAGFQFLQFPVTQAAGFLSPIGLQERFQSFGRGVISFSGILCFLSISAVMIYLSMVLIGRRHWLGGKDGQSMVGHYIVRTIALGVLALGVNVIATNYDVRADVSAGGVSSLSSDTRKLLSELDPERTVHIDAYISPEVPESYVQTRLNLLSMLHEFDSRGGGKVEVTIHDTEPFSEAAENAEQQFGIEGRQVRSRERGAIRQDEIYLGLAVTSGLDKVVVPFVDRGIPVEYELIRSIGTVVDKTKPKIGVLGSDARLFDLGERDQMIIDELRKQYEVEQVDGNTEIGEYACLVAVQPSTLPPPALENLIAAVKRGQPTAIFEDPVPFLDRSVPGTKFPGGHRGGPMAMFQGAQAPPKGNIAPLWDLLGVRYDENHVVWQAYNPYKAIEEFVSDEWVWVDPEFSEGAFSEEDPITSGLRQLLFLFPGSISKRPSSDFDVTWLASTSPESSGLTPVDAIIDPNPFSRTGGFMPDFERSREPADSEQYHLAAHIRGKLPADMEMADESGGDEEGEAEAAETEEKELNVVLVADIDCLYEAFFALRAQGEDPDSEINILVDNVTFVLNTVDSLAGVDDFIEIRKRGPEYRTLEKFERRIQEARAGTDEQRRKFMKEYEDQIAVEQSRLNDDIQKIRDDETMSDSQRQYEARIAESVRNRALDVKREQLQRKRERQIESIEKDLQEDIANQQDEIKLLAVFFPPLIPLLLGSVVFLWRRSLEREGVSQSRLRE